MKYNANYRVVLVGPMPHSTSGKGKSNSTIEEILNRPNYPRVEKLQSSNELKVTKSSFKEILETLIEEAYI